MIECYGVASCSSERCECPSIEEFVDTSVGTCATGCPGLMVGYCVDFN